MRDFVQTLRFRLLAAILRPLPVRGWRLVAALLATARWCADRRVHRIAGSALRALGRPGGQLARWRFAWELAYGRECDVLLGLVSERLTPNRVARHVACDRLPPPDGAVLVAIHHAEKRLAHAVLAPQAAGRPCGVVSAIPAHRRGEDEAQVRAFAARTGIPLALATSLTDYLARTSVEAIAPERAGRRGLALLRAGGWLFIHTDPQPSATPNCVVLGRALALPRGPRWLAERSGRPLIPYQIIPEGAGWRLWLGEPIPPTVEAHAQALEACIRRAPARWNLEFWEGWLAAPEAGRQSSGAGRQSSVVSRQ